MESMMINLFYDDNSDDKWDYHDLKVKSINTTLIQFTLRNYGSIGLQ